MHGSLHLGSMSAVMDCCAMVHVAILDACPLLKIRSLQDQSPSLCRSSVRSSLGSCKPQPRAVLSSY